MSTGNCAPDPELFNSEELGRYADVLLWAVELSRGRQFKSSETVLVEYDPPALPLAEALHEQILERNLLPVPRQRPTERMERDYLTKVNNKRLHMLPPGELECYTGVNGLIRLIAPHSVSHLSDVEAELLVRRRNARSGLYDLLWFQQVRQNMGRTMAVYPTRALADAAGLSLGRYAELIRQACFLGCADPVREWKRYRAEQQALLARLNRLRIKRLHVRSDRTNLLLTMGSKRRWVGLTGQNLPSFEIYTSPDHHGTEGVFWSNLPLYMGGVLVQGVRLVFAQGRVVSVHAHTGENRLRRFLALDHGACLIGEFSLTAADQSRVTQYMATAIYDENLGGPTGNCHIALGGSHPDAFDGDPADFTHVRRSELGFNESTQHWDLVNTEQKTVTAELVDGSKQVIYEDGIFRL
jgi:aminopeptidase